MEKIKFKVAVSINKPLAEVFKAFVDNTIIVNYFTTGASAPIKAAGEKIHWEWGKDNTDILITEYTENKTVSFTWPGYKVDYNTNVRFDFEEKNGKTVVTVTEEGWRGDDEGIKSSLANNSGWTDMLYCMKAWILYGIDLRK